MYSQDTIPKAKRPSGAQLRKRRVERGLPRYTPAEREARQDYSRRYDPERLPSNKRYWKRKAVVDEIKLTRGCADCGYNAHAAALEFDHLPGFEKKASVGNLTLKGTIEEALEEIAKCDVVCANCHAIRTATRREEKRAEKRTRGRTEQIAVEA